MGINTGIQKAINEHKANISKPHMIFSAENPKYPQHNQLKMDHPTVLNHLKGAGYSAHEVQGHYGAPERSIIVYGISPQHADHLHNLAAKLGQDSSIYSTGQKHEMHFHHGEDKGKKILGTGTVLHQQKPKDFYTSLPGGTHHFTHNFDFENPIMPHTIKKNETCVINTPTRAPQIPIPSNAKIILDQAGSPPGAIELMAMKFPDHVITEKEKAAIDACYINCHKEEIERWTKEMENYGIKSLGVEIYPYDKNSNPGAEGNGQMGIIPSSEETLNNQMLDKKEKIGTGVPNDYRKKARIGGDVLWKVKIKDRKYLTDHIPLHMSLKVFDEKQNIDLEKIKQNVKDLGIKNPDPNKLKFHTKIHHSDYSDADYYMLMVDGCDSSYKKFYDSMEGVKYKTYFMHITIDKPLYDEINKDGLKPNEISFSNLTVEKGAGNTIYEFGSDNSLEKSIKGKVAGAALAAASLMPMINPHMAKQPDMSQKNTRPQAKTISYNPDHMLRTIADVESNNGKNTNHKPSASGSVAYGKYGLMPDTIRETINMNHGLKSKYGKATILSGDQLSNFMRDNPGLEDAIAKQHLKRLERHFGQDPQKIGFSWYNGISGTNKAVKNKQDIGNHFHVKKIMSHYQGDK